MGNMATIHNLIMRRALIALAALAASMLLVLGMAALPAKAQTAPSGTTITVNTNVDELNVDGDCSLREAMDATRLNQAIDACPAGSSSGEDAIVFDPSTGGSVSLKAELPRIRHGEALVIKGPQQITAGSEGFRALWVQYGVKLTLRDLSFSDFKILYGKQEAPGRGGVVYSDGGTLVVDGSTFTKNWAGIAGGAIYSGYNGTLEVTGSTFIDNESYGLDPNDTCLQQCGGGAIFIASATPGSTYGTAKVTDSTFSSNNSREDEGGGGAIRNRGTLLEVTGSTFAANVAENQGGAIFHGDGEVPYDELHVTNSTFSYNRSQGVPDGSIYAGGIFLYPSGVANITYSTFVNSSIGGNGPLPHLRGTILTSSYPKNCPRGVHDEGYNISSDGSCNLWRDNSMSNTDPLLDPYRQDNGGPTTTFALQPTSPAIDAIERDANGCAPAFESSHVDWEVTGFLGPLSDVTQDQRGAKRPQGQGCDIGSFEGDNAPPSAPVITAPAQDTHDNDGSFTLSGTAEPNSSVELFDGGNSLNQDAAVDAEGNWFFELTNVPEGSHSYTLKATDLARKTSEESQALTVIVDKTAPGAPLITSPAQGARLNYRSFNVSGTAEAGAKVELFEGALSKGTATADSYGKWRITLSGVTEGSHSYTAKATDQAGNTSAPSSTRAVIVDTTKPKVTSVVPAENATAVWDANVTATFSEAMKATTINTTTFQLYKEGSTTAIAATVNYDPIAKKATLNPDALLEVGVTYKAVVTTGAKDLAGNALDQNPTLTGNQNKVWYFKVIFDPTDQ